MDGTPALIELFNELKKLVTYLPLLAVFGTNKPTSLEID